MSDLDRELKALNEIEAPDLWDDITTRPRAQPPRLPSPGRRVAIAALSLGLSLLVLVWAAIAFDLTSPGDRTPPGSGPVAELGATVLGVGVSAPSSWTLVDLWPLVHSMATWPDPSRGEIDLPPDIRDRGGLPVLQLSNRDLGLGSACTGTAPTGDQAVLYVALNAGPYLIDPGGSPRWSDSLSPSDGPCGRGMYAYLATTTSTSERPYLVFAGFGPEVTAGDRQIVMEAFGSLRLAPVELLPPAETTPGYVLDGLQLGDSDYTLEARPSAGGGVDLSLVNGRQPEVSSIRLEGVGRSGDPDLAFAQSGLVVLASPEHWSGLPPTNVARAVFGVASGRAARVQVRIPSAGSYEAPVLPIPSSLGTSFGAFVVHVPPVVDGTVAALAADGSLVAEASLGQGRSPAPSVSPTPEPAAEAQSALRNALAAALTYYTDGGTFAGFDPETASSIEPSLIFSDAPVSREGVVSIREVTRSTILLTTQSRDGLGWCIADDLGVGSGRATYGRSDATTIGECADPSW